MVGWKRFGLTRLTPSLPAVLSGPDSEARPTVAPYGTRVGRRITPVVIHHEVIYKDVPRLGGSRTRQNSLPSGSAINRAVTPSSVISSMTRAPRATA
jgi:hypothetical protein